MLCVLQGTAASGCVVPPRDFESWVGHYPAGRDVTTVPDHSYWLRPQPKAGGRRGDRGAHARAEIGMEQGWESRDSVQKEKEASGRALLSALYFDRRAKRHAEETPHIRRVSDQTSLVITEKVHHGNMGIFQRTSSKVLTNSTSTNQS